MVTRTSARNEQSIYSTLQSWSGLLNGDDGAPTLQMGTGDRVAQVTGTFGAGGTAIIEGSLDGTNWFQLRDPSSALISFTASGGKALLEAVPYVRPRVTAGDGTTNLTCLISLRTQ